MATVRHVSQGVSHYNTDVLLQSTKASTLLTLPRELRDIIISYAVVKPMPTPHDVTYQIVYPSLACTCTQLRTETLPLYISQNTFFCMYVSDTEAWLKRIRGLEISSTTCNVRVMLVSTNIEEYLYGYVRMSTSATTGLKVEFEGGGLCGTCEEDAVKLVEEINHIYDEQLKVMRQPENRALDFLGWLKTRQADPQLWDLRGGRCQLCREKL